MIIALRPEIDGSVGGRDDKVRLDFGQLPGTFRIETIDVAEIFGSWVGCMITCGSISVSFFGYLFGQAKR